MMADKEEQETIIIFDELGENASVYTYNSRLQKRLRELQGERPQAVVCNAIHQETGKHSERWEVPKDWIKINPKRASAPLSDEQREQLRERMAFARNRRGV